MRGEFRYTVTASCPDVATRARFESWLLDEGHVAAVIAAGALEAEVVRRAEDDALVVEVRYAFTDAAAYARYLREHAPRLRAEGLARFGPTVGVVFDRAEGVVIRGLSG